MAFAKKNGQDVYWALNSMPDPRSLYKDQEMNTPF